MNGIKSLLYNSAPVFVQNVAVTAFGFGWRQRRFGGIFKEELKKFKTREQFNVQQWDDYSNSQLKKLLKHAFETVPYYKTSFINAGLKSETICNLTINEISRLPFLEKKDLRAFGTSTLLSSLREKGGEFFPSSGSTGTPTQILFSHPMHQRWSAGFEARIRHWAGVDRFTSRGTIGGRRVVPDGDAREPFYRYNFMEKQVYFSAYHISAAHARNYLEGMKKHQIQYMTGYAMSNFFLARFLEELKLDVPPLKAVITSSEKLTGSMRETFQRVYQCKTFDSWSGLEACGLVSECEHGSLHISPDLGLVELLDDEGKPVAPGEVGEVVCTGFVNYDQPLIRYRIGDLMRLGDKPCACGRAMPVIKEIVGRIEDTVVGKDGREMVRFHGIFINLPNLIEAQIIQHTVDQFEIKVVTNGKWTSDEANLITKRMISQLGDIQLNIREVDTIARNPSGKFPAVISHVKRSI
ncbi:MAG: phenylacetate--CoA ligase family protein [Cyclobacteriaceae bacterium]|nr:MAG: phenylacetate--CoA ligase family protein [Cyclobacteriaceae bacterium]